MDAFIQSALKRCDFNQFSPCQCGKEQSSNNNRVNAKPRPWNRSRIKLNYGLYPPSAGATFLTSIRVLFEPTLSFSLLILHLIHLSIPTFIYLSIISSVHAAARPSSSHESGPPVMTLSRGTETELLLARYQAGDTAGSPGSLN